MKSFQKPTTTWTHWATYSKIQPKSVGWKNESSKSILNPSDLLPNFDMHPFPAMYASICVCTLCEPVAEQCEELFSGFKSEY